MASIRVVKNVNPITIRIGQRTVKKVVASEKAATTTLASLQQLEQVQDGHGNPSARPRPRGPR